MKKLILIVLALIVSTATYSQLLDTVNIGGSPNDGTGDNLRSAFIKVNDVIDTVNTYLVAPYDTINGDWIVIGKVEGSNFTINYPDTIDMDDYVRVEEVGWPRAAYDYHAKKINIYPPSDPAYGFLTYYRDSIDILSSTSKILGYDSKGLFLNTIPDVHINNLVNTAWSKTAYLDNFINDHPNGKVQAFQLINRMNPLAGDTVLLGRAYGMSAEVQTYTPEATARVKVDEMRVLNVFASFDNYVAVDSVIGVMIHYYNTGIPADSIRAVYGIYNLDDGIRGDSITYFLYSEYGDNYLEWGCKCEKLRLYL